MHAIFIMFSGLEASSLRRWSWLNQPTASPNEVLIMITWEKNVKTCIDGLSLYLCTANDCSLFQIALLLNKITCFFISQIGRLYSIWLRKMSTTWQQENPKGHMSNHDIINLPSPEIGMKWHVNIFKSKIGKQNWFSVFCQFNWCIKANLITWI